MSTEREKLALVRQIERRIGRMEHRLKRIEDLLSDASQKLCHLIKRQKESPREADDDF